MLKDWNDFFNQVKAKDYYIRLNDFLDEEYKTKTIYPPRELIYNAFELTSPKDIKVVILGQDPYHNPGQAMGLSFSVPKGIKLPPSLVNIYREISNDFGCEMKDNGDLTYLAKQGCLMINAYLTVIENQPLSHHKKEYDKLMEDLFNYLDTLNQPIVFMLWGNFAKKYTKYINNKNHLVIEATHPSPLGANKGGWFNTHQFKRCNDFLSQNNVSVIDWKN
ncbi:MAG: uracil-DNA glycosylase [Bacilli bacterium]|nr:uracil-DNA glycosylase [Bacilli bacterium]